MLAIFIGLIVAFAITLLFMFPMARGAVYVPSKDEAIQNMITLAKIKKGTRIAELGSGDGRVVAALTQAGASVDGYEINPWLVFKSRQLLKKLGMHNQSQIFLKSYWDVDMSEYDVVTVYGITYIMEGLEDKLRSELRPGSMVLSNYFEFPNWKPKKKLNGVWQYVV